MSISGQLLGWLSDCVIESYLDDCLDAGRKPKTVSWYRWQLTRARDWLADDPAHHPLDFLDPVGLRAYYRSTRNLAQHTTRRHMVSALRAFGSWLEQNHGIPNPAASLPKPSKDKRLPEVLPPSEVSRLLDIIDQEPARERAMVLLLLDAGLRVSELVALKRVDLDLAAGQLTVRLGKGDKGRVVYFFEKTAHALADYLATHDHPYVFLSQRVGRPPAPLTRNGVRQILRALGKRHGFAGLKPHKLRRTCGTELVANGADLSSVMDQFGHEDVETVRIYVRLADERRRKVLRRASPVEKGTDRNGIPVPGWPINDEH